MGTNFYWHASGEKVCPHCRQEMPSLHIGKSSAGWCFALRIHPDRGINNLEDWKRHWETGLIVDEDGDPVEVADMIKRITERSWSGNPWTPEALRRNGAVAGPNGLARHTYGDTQPGDGTYDLCNHEFS